MIERHDPYGPMLSVRQMMDRLLEDAFVVPRQVQDQGGAGSMRQPALNAHEEGGNLVVEAELPGLTPEDIDISVEQGVLTIRGQSKQEEERQERNYFLREYRTTNVSRSLRLPNNVNPDACEARYDHGVLRLTFPQAQEKKPRRIQIQSGGSQQLDSGKAGEGAQGRPAKQPAD